METFKIIYTLLGGLGIFFYGMKMMSDALQQAASDVITKVINSLTSNRVLAVVVGMIVTMIVQSSSVTTVMVVGFVNAGLMNLTQAIGVILGSNIGTTITGWIISIKVGKYGLLFIGIGIFPALFAKSNRLQNLGKVLFGVGMIFMGLEFMSGAFKPLRTNTEFLNMISYFSGQDYGSYFASILTGCLLTVIVQSSSAMLGITIALATTGIIQFPTAAALVLGENIGTTITALLASVGTNTNAKRAARAHAFFNVFGVLIIFSILPYYINFIDYIIPTDPNFLDNDGYAPNVAAHIAASHSIFNITATILFLPFIGALAKFVTKLTPATDEDEVKQLKLVGDVADIVPATAIILAESETKKMKDVIDRMYRTTRSFLEKPAKPLYQKVESYEDITDNMQKEVTVFLCQVMEKPLSDRQSLKCQGIIKIVDELESIADYLDRLVKYKNQFGVSKIAGDSNDEFYKFMDDVWTFYQTCLEGFLNNNPVNMNSLFATSEELRKMADAMRDRHLERVSRGEYEPLSALTYSDMVVALRKIRAHAMNVAEAVDMYSKEEA